MLWRNAKSLSRLRGRSGAVGMMAMPPWPNWAARRARRWAQRDDGAGGELMRHFHRESGLRLSGGTGRLQTMALVLQMLRHQAGRPGRPKTPAGPALFSGAHSTQPIQYRQAPGRADIGPPARA